MVQEKNRPFPTFTRSRCEQGTGDDPHQCVSCEAIKLPFPQSVAMCLQAGGVLDFKDSVLVRGHPVLHATSAQQNSLFNKLKKLVEPRLAADAVRQVRAVELVLFYVADTIALPTQQLRDFLLGPVGSKSLYL